MIKRLALKVCLQSLPVLSGLLSHCRQIDSCPCDLLSHEKLLTRLRHHLAILWALKEHHDCRAHLEHADFFTLAQEYAIWCHCVGLVLCVGGARLFQLRYQLLLLRLYIICDSFIGLLKAIHNVVGESAFVSCRVDEVVLVAAAAWLCDHVFEVELGQVFVHLDHFILVDSICDVLS